MEEQNGVDTLYNLSLSYIPLHGGISSSKINQIKAEDKIFLGK